MLSLDHIAIAVPDLDEAIARWSADLGFALSGTEEVEPAKTNTAFFVVTDPARPVRVELVSPLRGEGPIAGHLAKRGPGLHHLCFRTDDLQSDMEKLTAKGYRFTSEGPAPGAHGTIVAFLHPKTTGGVLIELAQYPEESP